MKFSKILFLFAVCATLSHAEKSSTELMDGCMNLRKQLADLEGGLSKGEFSLSEVREKLMKLEDNLKNDPSNFSTSIPEKDQVLKKVEASAAELEKQIADLTKKVTDATEQVEKLISSAKDSNKQSASQVESAENSQVINIEEQNSKPTDADQADQNIHEESTEQSGSEGTLSEAEKPAEEPSQDAVNGSEQAPAEENINNTEENVEKTDSESDSIAEEQTSTETTAIDEKTDANDAIKEAEELTGGSEENKEESSKEEVTETPESE